MKRVALLILTLFLLFINCSVQAAQKYTKKAIKAVSTDGFNINATLTYPKIKTQKEFKTVVLLHSLGYNSTWWGDLPQRLLEHNYAVLSIDLRGHGTSVYDYALERTSWKDITNKAYSKYPDDVLAVINKVKEENSKRIFFNNWAIVGSDIGASAGILAADKSKVRPKTIVMLSPVTETKGLYIPVSIAHLDNVDILAITGTDDTLSKDAADYLSKFAQAHFAEYTSESKTSGMLMIKNDESLTKVIAEWITAYFN